MVQTGLVKKIRGEIADVEITRSTACGDNCAACGLCSGRSVTVKALNAANAAEGDTVLIKMADKKVLGAAFLIYIIPLLLLVSGYFAGHGIFGTEPAGIASGFALMALSFPPIIYYDKRARKRYLPEITKVIEKGAI